MLAAALPYLFSFLPKEPRIKAERNLIAMEAAQAAENAEVAVQRR